MPQIGSDSIGGTASPVTDSLVVHLNTDRIQMEPGGTPVELGVSIQNLGDVVDQYTVELTGLDPDWFTAPVASIGLFPQDREQVRISLHPPKRPGLRAGAYPFAIMVRSRGGTQQQTVNGTLDVRGYAVYRLDLTPRRQTAHGNGRFEVEIANTGNADVRLALAGRDQEDACHFRFPKDDTPQVRAGTKAKVPIIVQPVARPWVGPERSYDFTITARPQDAGGDPQTIPGQFTYRPLFASWAPVRRLLGLAAFTVLALVLASVLVQRGLVQEFPRRFEVATAVVRGLMCGVPVVGGLCPSPAGDESALAQRQASNCSFRFGFKEFAEAEPKLIGDCQTNELSDRFGNSLQYTTNGLLVWQKDSSTAYFFRGNSLWAYIQGHTQLLYGPGAF